MRGLDNLSTGVNAPRHTMFGGYAQFAARSENYWIKTSASLSVDWVAAGGPPPPRIT
jgi:putative oxidoreductase